MKAVEFSKCHNCGKIRHVNDLRDNFEEIGLICVDEDQCDKERAKAKGENRNEE